MTDLIIIILTIAVFGFGILFFLERRSKQILTEDLSRIKHILLHLNPSKRIENNINLLLEVIGRYVKASHYAFYILDQEKKNYVLKAVRKQNVDPGQIRPSYSGLAPYLRVNYLPPIALPIDLISKEMFNWKKDGKDLILYISINGTRSSLISLGPFKTESRGLQKKLESIMETFPGILEMLLEADRQMTERIGSGENI